MFSALPSEADIALYKYTHGLTLLQDLISRQWLIASLTWLPDRQSKTLAKRWANNRYRSPIDFTSDNPPRGGPHPAGDALEGR